MSLHAEFIINKWCHSGYVRLLIHLLNTVFGPHHFVVNSYTIFFCWNPIGFLCLATKNGNFIWLQSANLPEMLVKKIVWHLYRNLWGGKMENTVISIFAVPSGITLPLYFLLSQSCFLEQITQILYCVFRWEERELRVKMHPLPKSFWQLFWQKNLFIK